MNYLPPNYVISPAVARPRQLGLPVVALETAVLTHGLPRPENLRAAREMESQVFQHGATPATIALLAGKVHIGLTTEQLEQLSRMDGLRKISRRDFGLAIARGESGGTTVSGTLVAAHQAGIRVFATGGIGGVHRGGGMDVSADLPELGRTPVLVVCSGAKSILDLPATLEVLETQGVPVIGLQTDEFPAFYSRESGLQVNLRVETPQEAAQIALAHWQSGVEGAVLLVVPPPEEVALPARQVESWIDQALREAGEKHIHGPAVTPFLLDRVAHLSGGASLQANLGLLFNNARVAAEAAAAIPGPTRLRSV